MIRLKRPAPPERLAITLASRSDEAAKFYQLHKDARAQTRLDFSLRVEWLELGFSKCAYCEQKLTRTTVNTSRYRPEAAARDWPEKNREWPEHYWWLAFEWRNLVPLCSICTSSKRNFFPVAKRSRIGASRDQLTREHALLIDPFKDNPAEFIDFDEEGLAIAKSRRGRVTIQLLSLNRTDLVSKRLQAIRTLGSESFKIAPTQREFAGCLVAVLRARQRKKKTQAKRRKAPQKQQIAKQTGSVPFQYIRQIQIRNFRAIEKLEIEIPQTRADPAATTQGWKVVIGENATGKSTVLKAIAIALVGKEAADELDLKPKDMLRRWKRPNGSMGHARKGHIKLRFLSGLEHSVEFDQKSIRFTAGTDGLQGSIRAFGSMRLLPDSNPVNAPQTVRSTDVQNLFNPRRSLLDAEKYLLGLPLNAFNSFAKALKALLGLQFEKDIERRNNCVYFHLENAPIALGELSDGYQCMVALAVDFMSSIPNVAEMQFAEGIVLLDELGTHLHPRWRMAFVQRFRDCFNRVQVIGTTHEPLCLLGLEQDEVMLLRRRPDHSIECVDEDLPNPAGMRADQILTSSLFGLNSTIDPRLEEQFQQYYRLLALPEDELTTDQRADRERLARELRPQRALGFTRRDQAMYDFIDEYLAKELTTSGAVSRRRLKTQTMEKLRAIWAEVDVERLVQ